ncbi:TPA: DNA topoisomerase [Streptococcus suis]
MSIKRLNGTVVALAEKKSQADSYAAAFSNVEDKKGYYVVSDPGVLNGTRIIIIWASGHLLALKEPEEYDEKWKSWSLDVFPVFPSTFEYKIAKGSEKRYAQIEKWLHRADTIIWAGDIDREGSYISYTLCYYAGVMNNDRQFLRLWVNDLLPNTIKDGFNNLRPIADSYRQARAGRARAIADWLTGMNGSRVLLQLLKQYEIEIPKGYVASLGRVMTATLYIVYSREQEIMNFVPRKYYGLEAYFQHPNGMYIGKLLVPDVTLTKGANAGKKWNGQLDTPNQWGTFLNRYKLDFSNDLPGVVTGNITEKKKALSPSLFSLGELQKFMNKNYGYTAKQVKDAVQFLYDHQYLSYPRTESSYLTMEDYLKKEKTATKLFTLLNISEDLLRTGHKPSGKYVNDDEAAIHSAIVTTDIIPNHEVIQSWKEREQRVYIEVAKRTAAMFMPVHEYEQTEIITTVGGLDFQTTGKRTIVNGWRELLVDLEQAREAQTIIPVELNDKVCTKLETVEKNVTKPTLYTEAGLLSAMQRAGYDSENPTFIELMKDIKGIGTPATRDDTIEKLKSIKQVEISKSKFSTSSVGKMICEAISKFDYFTNPETTASWELELRKIENGELEVGEFIQHIAYELGLVGDITLPMILEKQISTFKDNKSVLTSNSQDVEIDYGYCPVCLLKGRGNSIIKDYPKVLKCSKSILPLDEIENGAAADCNFTLFKKFFDISWKKNDLMDLIALHETRMITSKYGLHKYRLVYDELKGTYIPKRVI